ncbi:hypothetical protein Noda2021_11200 [Candidatus Dependentiae bacterium Noda2021]|nr:hypothetical protein Noda2021_11200 [Candidatus Dependentiae bacterium Noda2021]
MNMRLILFALLFASLPLSASEQTASCTPDKTKTERFIHFTKASVYGCFAMSSLLMAASTGWAYWFHKQNPDLKYPVFLNEDYKKNQALAGLILSGATFGYTTSKALEHSVKIFASKPTSDALAAKLDRFRHVCKSGYWVGAIVGCYAVVNELEKIRTEQHIAPHHFAVHYGNQESANNSYNLRVKALTTVAEGAAMVATGYPLFRAIKEAEYAVNVSPNTVSVTLHI